MVEKTRKADAKTAAAGLTTDLTRAEERVKTLEREAAGHANFCLSVGLVCDELRVSPLPGTNTLLARVASVTGRVGELERDALRAGIQQSFAIARSHYEDNIALDMMSQGYAPVYEEDDLVVMEAAMAPLA